MLQTTLDQPIRKTQPYNQSSVHGLKLEIPLPTPLNNTPDAHRLEQVLAIGS